MIVFVFYRVNVTFVSLAVPAGTLAVRPLLCLLRGGWYHLLHIDLPQPNRGLLSSTPWKEPLCAAVAQETSLLYREGTVTSASCHYHCAMIAHRVSHRHCTQAEIRTSLSQLFEDIGNNSGPALNFIRSRVERMSEQWIQAGGRLMRSSNKTLSSQMRV